MFQHNAFRRLTLPFALLLLLLAFAIRPTEAADNATIIINTLNDTRQWTGDCSLRDAVITANTGRRADACELGNAPGQGIDTIVLDPALAGGTIFLDGTIYSQSITTIQGDFTIDGQQKHQLISVTQVSSLTLVDVTLQNGRSDIGGGAIRVDSGSLALRNTQFNNNVGSVGGAILVLDDGVGAGGRLYIENSSFIDNRATRSGGAIKTGETIRTEISNSHFTNNSAPEAGAIQAGSDLIVSNTVFDANRATAHDVSRGRGGAILATGGTVVINDTYFNGNQGRTGMAIYATDTARIDLGNNHFFYNKTFANAEGVHGGAVAMFNTNGSVTGDEYIGNQSNYDGGGLYIQNSRIGIWESTFADNSAENGGAIALVQGSNVLINLNEIRQNSAEQRGGGVYVATSDLTMPTNSVHRNSAAIGGGLYTAYSDAFVLDTDFIQNSASANGGESPRLRRVETSILSSSATTRRV